MNVLSPNIKRGIQRSICGSPNFFFFFVIIAYVISPQALNSAPVRQARFICIQPFHHQVRLKSDNKQHMRREDFDTADQRQPHLCSPRQICLLISFHPAEGLRWLTSVAAHPGQSATHPGDLKDNFVLKKTIFLCRAHCLCCSASLEPLKALHEQSRLRC